IAAVVPAGWVLRVLQLLEQILCREPAGSEAGDLHGTFDAAQDRLELCDKRLVLLTGPLNRLLLADGKATELSVLLRRVIQLGMDSGVPDEIDMEARLEIVATLLFLPPHSQPMGVEGHDLRDLSALL